MYRRWGCELRPSGFNPACLWPCLSTSPVEMAGTKAQAAAVILGHHAPVSYGGNACLGATQRLREHRTAPAYECTALACVLQPLEGGQAAIPSMQPCFSCSGIRAAPPDGGADGNTVNAANRSDRKYRQRLLITMVTRASFNNQYLSSEPP